MEDEKLMFDNLLLKDPTPGVKNRVIRIDNYYLVPGWVFGKEEPVKITYKNIKSRGVKAYNLTGQIIYDILILGLTDISQRPRCQICGKPVNYDSFSVGYNKTCRSAECIAEYARREVLNLWKDSDYRNTQSKSHKEWSAIEEHKQLMSEYSKRNWANEEYRKSQIKSHLEWASKEENKKILIQKLLGQNKKSKIECNKSIEDMYYDSGWEKDFIEFCINSDSIISIERSGIFIEYTDECGLTRNYHPDFLVTTITGKKFLVEIKNDWRYNNDDRTKLKIEAGYAYVANSNDIDEYIVLLEKDIYVKKSQINIEALSKKLEII